MSMIINDYNYLTERHQWDDGLHICIIMCNELSRHHWRIIVFMFTALICVFVTSCQLHNTKPDRTRRPSAHLINKSALFVLLEAPCAPSVSAVDKRTHTFSHAQHNHSNWQLSREEVRRGLCGNAESKQVFTQTHAHARLQLCLGPACHLSSGLVRPPYVF